MNYPLVTVMTLMYNTKASYVIEGIQSVIRNGYPHVEHIFIDDCSPDQSHSLEVENWIKENKYPCIFIRNEVNQGVSKNLNHIIHTAKGKYLIGCCDDILADDRIFKDVELFERLPDDYAVIVGYSQSIDAEGNLLPIISPNPPTPKDDNFFNYLIKDNIIPGPATTTKRSILESVGGYSVGILPEDYDLWLRLSHQGFKFKVRPGILIFYRVLSTSLSNHPKLYMDVFRVKAKFPDRINLKFFLDEEIKRVLISDEQDKYKEIIKFYKEQFPKSWFIKLLDGLRFKTLRLALLNAKYFIGSLIQKMKGNT